jgi:hypothetical protein
VDELNRYPGSPIRGSRWNVRRAGHRLVSTETPITPWIDALDAFCRDPAHSDASSDIRARVERCAGDADVRWAEGKRLVVTLDLILRCDPDYASHVSNGELQLQQRAGKWRVVEASPCLASAEP